MRRSCNTRPSASSPKHVSEPDGRAQPIPTPASASPAESLGHSGADPSESSDPAADTYLAQIRQRIDQFKRYPTLARRAGETGHMLFRLAIDREGKLAELDLISSEASDRLIAAGREAIEKAAPFGAPPVRWKGGLTVRIPIRFTTVTGDASP